MASSSSVVFPNKRRDQPGNPDPDVEVIALSPRTLMETNRFLCEVCQKGFQREQNLQLHRRGHNLPWKLKKKAANVAHRKVYLCPEPTCVHHDPSRALGDLTGIKKHFLRKHGEKKYNCNNCSKKYAVLSDWKAHSKTCSPGSTVATAVLSFPDPPLFMPMVPSSSTFFLLKTLNASPKHDHDLLHNHSGGGGSSFAALGLYNPSYFSKKTNSGGESGNVDNSSTMLFQSHFKNGRNNGLSDGSLFSAVPSLFTPSPLHQVAEASHMSATTLLQKAAQMGSTSSNTRSTLQRTFSGEHHHQFGGGMYDVVASITSPPGNYSSYVGAANLNFGSHESPLKLCKSSSNEHGRLFGSQEGLTRDFLGIRPAGSGGGETSEDKKPPPLSFKGPAFGVGGVCFK